MTREEWKVFYRWLETASRFRSAEDSRQNRGRPLPTQGQGCPIRRAADAARDRGGNPQQDFPPLSPSTTCKPSRLRVFTIANRR
jgi:hypothetical protein